MSNQDQADGIISMTRFNVYLVWELIPDATHVYHLTLSEEEYRRVKKCHGHFVNVVDTPSDVEEDLEWLSEYLEKHPSDLVCDTESKRGQPIPVSNGILVLSGFVL